MSYKEKIKIYEFVKQIVSWYMVDTDTYETIMKKVAEVLEV